MTPWELAKTSEHSHQRALFAWANMAEAKGLLIANDGYAYSGKYKDFPGNPIPQLKWLHAIHNQGHGDAIRGAKAKAEGVKSGIADIFLPWPQYPYHGCYIELKVGKNKPSVEQLQFAEYCTKISYRHYICYGWEAARDALLDYLRLTP